jgi:hypothetical protein
MTRGLRHWPRCGTAHIAWPDRSPSAGCAASRCEPAPAARPESKGLNPWRVWARAQPFCRGLLPHRSKQPGRVVDHDPGTSAIAAHRTCILVSRVRHDLLVQRAVQRRLGDRPGAQPVRRELFGRGDRDLRRCRPHPQDLVDPVAGQPPLDRFGRGDIRRNTGPRPPQPCLQRADRAGLGALHAWQGDIRPAAPV